MFPRTETNGQRQQSFNPCNCLESSCWQNHPSCIRNTETLTSYRDNTSCMGVTNKFHANDKHLSYVFNEEEHKNWFRDSHTDRFKQCVLRENNLQVSWTPDEKSQILPELPSLPSSLNLQIVMPKLIDCASRCYVNIENNENRIFEQQSTKRNSSLCNAEPFSRKELNFTTDRNNEMVDMSSIVNASTAANKNDCIEFHPHFDDLVTSTYKTIAHSTKMRCKNCKTFKLRKMKEIVSTTSIPMYDLTTVQTHEIIVIKPVSTSLPCVKLAADNSQINIDNELNRKKRCDKRRSSDKMSVRSWDLKSNNS